jgi:hypothetical protein
MDWVAHDNARASGSEGILDHVKTLLHEASV